MDYLLQGGWVMAAIVLSSVIALAVFVERIFYLNFIDKNVLVIRREIQERFRGLKVGDAIAICDNHPGIASNIIRAGLSMATRSRDEMEKAMDNVANKEISKLNKNLPILATIVNISTLLGLLGTVLGMITSTSVLASQGLGNPQELIGGIAQALVTTAAGLIVSIPALIGYNYLVTRVDNIIIEIETTAADLVKVLKPGLLSAIPPTVSHSGLKQW
ncbi:MAG: MotA/TolQ/ExbB proton channel family protein [Brevinemataceae bacterium]